MKEIEAELQRVCDKDQCHRLIDEMPDDAQAIFLVVDYDKNFAKHVVYGHPTSERLLWMIEQFRRWLFATAREIDEPDE